MKTHALPSRVSPPLLVAGLLLVIGPSAFATNFSPIATQTIATQTKTPAEALLAEIKPTPYSARNALRDKLKEAEARFAEKIPEWESKKDALPSEKKSEAEAIFKQLVTDREILRQKIDAVEDAQAETWTSAKSELYTALQNTISTYNRLKVIFDS